MFLLFLSVIENSGKNKKFLPLFIKYRRIMFSDAFAILKNKKDAEDAVQTACLSLIPHIDDDVFDDVESDGARKYVRKTVKNAAIYILDKRKTPVITKNEPYEDFEDEIINRIAEKDLFNAVIRVIKGMDKKYRDVLYRRLFLGQSVKEIAKETNTKPDTVKKRIERGIKIIREKVNPNDYGYKV